MTQIPNKDIFMEDFHYYSIYTAQLKSYQKKKLKTNKNHGLVKKY